MPLSKPLNVKKFYILLALSGESLHGYAIHQQVISDSRQSLYFSFTSLYRCLREMTVECLIEPAEFEQYKITDKGRQRLRLESNDFRNAVELAAQRLRK